MADRPPGPTPSQTIGPFFAHALPAPDGPLCPYAVPADVAGGFWLRGRVLDGAGEPVPDALIESWQVEPAAFARCPTDPEGRYAIWTVPPGRVRDPSGGWQAPHIDLSVFARGLFDRVVTRVYFADETAANATDPVLSALSEDRRATVLAHPDVEGWRFDIRLQGDAETAFFLV